MIQDWRLLREYVENGSEAAFAHLVEQYANLVYSACLREVQEPALAEDVTQVVFLLLARKAATIREGTILAGWLFQTARFASKNALKQERRRQQREQKATAAMTSDLQPHPANWQEIESLLHDGLVTLGTQERHAVLLRFFQGKSLKDTGAALGISEDAARMRVTRALDKLRRHFARHGFVVPALALAGMLTAHAVHAAPAQCLAAATRLAAPDALAAHTVAAHSIGAHPNGTVGARVPSLYSGVRRTLLMQKLRVVAALSFSTVVVGVGANALGRHALSKPQPRPSPIATTMAVSHQIAPPRPMAVSAVAPRVQVVSKGTVLRTAAPRSLTAVSIPTRETYSRKSNPVLPSAVLVRKRPEPPRKSLALAPRLADHFTAVRPATQLESPPPAVPTAPLIVASAPAKTFTTPVPPAATHSDSSLQTAPAVAAMPAPVSATPAASTSAVAPPSVTTEAQVAAPALPVQGQTRQLKPYKLRRLRGQVMAVNDSDSSITIQTRRAGLQTLTVASDTKILMDQKAHTLDELRPGMSVLIGSADGQTAASIEAGIRRIAPGARSNRQRRGWVRPRRWWQQPKP